LGSAIDEFDNVVEVKKPNKKTKKNKKLLLNKLRKHSKEKRLPTRRPTRLRILSHQRQAKESCVKTGARTGCGT